jgi:hypothetical protein
LTFNFFLKNRTGKVILFAIEGKIGMGRFEKEIIIVE